MTMRRAQREDIFVSVCCTTTARTADLLTPLEPLSQALGTSFRYWEILIVTHEEIEGELEDIVAKLPNVRVLKVRHGTPFYRSRLVGASEAIGDVVVLTSPEELALFDVVNMVEIAASRSSIVIGRRGRSSLTSPLLQALGRAAGFRVNAEDMLTSAYPRTLLNQLLANPDRELALRFPPAERSFPVVYQPYHGNGKARSFREVGRRLGLIQRLLVSSAPAVLTAVALFSLVVAISALAFAVYAVLVWLTLDAIQPGWFTTALALSLTASFLGVAIFGLSIGLQKVLETLQNDPMDDITGERSAVDLFGRVMQELNVEVAVDPSHQHVPQERKTAWHR